METSTNYNSVVSTTLAKCNPQEEQEIGREQVLDEIRHIIRKHSRKGKI